MKGQIPYISEPPDEVWPKFDTRKWDLFLSRGSCDTLPEKEEDITEHFEMRMKQAQNWFGQSDHNEFFPSSKYPRMLIIGPGCGAEIITAKQLGYEATGIGFMGERWKGETEKRGGTFQTMDMCDLRFPNGSFDVVYSCHSLEHTAHPWLACIEMWAVLRDGGRACIQMPDPTTEKIGNHHWFVLPKEIWTRMFELCGFKIIKATNILFVIEKWAMTTSHMLHCVMEHVGKRMIIGEEYK